MAFTLRGFGAMHYGKRDFHADGSHVTTLWIVAAYLPIVPLHSRRLRPTGEVKYYALRPRATYVVLEKTAPNLTQVLCVYAWFTAEVVIFFTAVKLNSWPIAIPGVLLLGLPFLLRRRATARVKAKSEREAMGFSPELSE